MCLKFALKQSNRKAVLSGIISIVGYKKHPGGSSIVYQSAGIGPLNNQISEQTKVTTGK